MIAQSCIAIETKIFPVLEGEDDEIVNEGMYGKALCNYLAQHLPNHGIQVSNFCTEDWGWWLEVEDHGFKMGLCIYSQQNENLEPEKYAILPSIDSEKKWSWTTFRNINIAPNVLKIIDTLEKIFQEEKGIITVTRHDDFPF